MAIAEVGSGSQRQPVRGNGADTATAVYPANITAGNLLTLQFGGWSPTTEDTSLAVTDTRGTTWTTLLAGAGIAAAYAGGEAKPAIAYGIAPSSGACTVTVNPSGTGDYFNGVIDEWSGVDSAPLDVDGGATLTLTATPSASLTTVTAGALVLAVIILSSGTPVTFTPDAAYTQQDEDETANRQLYSAISLIAGAAGSYSPNWTLGSTVSGYIYAVAFKAGAGAPAAVSFPFHQPNRMIAHLVR